MTWKRTILKTFLRIAALWLFVGVIYLILPSFSPNQESTASSLLEGHAVTRVFETNYFYKRRYWYPYPDEDPEPKNPPSVDRFLSTWTQHFSVDVRVERNSTGRVDTLVIGGGKDPLANVPFFADRVDPLTETSISLDLDFSKTDPSISELFTIDVPAVFSSGSDYTFRWFSDADGGMIEWWYHPHSAVSLPLRVHRDPVLRQVQVWPEHYQWEFYPQNKTLPQYIKPFLTIQLHSAERDESEPSFIFPDPPASSSPTPYTYHIRLYLLLFLLPLSYLAVGLIYLVLIPAFYIAVVVDVLIRILSFFVTLGLFYLLFWWLRNGRPSLSEMRERYREWGGVDVNVGFSGSLIHKSGGGGVALEGPERDLEAQTSAGNDRDASDMPAPSTST